MQVLRSSQRRQPIFFSSLSYSTRSIDFTTYIMISMMMMIMIVLRLMITVASFTFVVDHRMQSPSLLLHHLHLPPPQRISFAHYYNTHRQPFLQSPWQSLFSSITFTSNNEHQRLYMSSSSRAGSSSYDTKKINVDLNSNDPYTILGLSRNSIITEKELKRKYRQLALQYHPDMTTTLTSTSSEKQRAAAQFTKINQAYQTILNQIQGKGTSSSSSSSSSSTGSSAWEPPHRRTRSYTSSSSTSTTTSSSTGNDQGGFGVNTDWRDYIPKSDKDEVYDTNGDSFGQIFSDLFTGTAATVMGTAAKNGVSGIFSDFIDFLEQNVDGYSSSRRSGIDNNGDDTELRILLQMGSKVDIGNEMEESELVVQQLTNKLQKVQEEMTQIQNDILMNESPSNIEQKKKYSEVFELQERQEELQSQLRIVERYLQRARSRLTKLQIRYKELLVSSSSSNNNNNSNGNTTTRTTTIDPATTSSTPYTSSYSSSNNPSTSTSTTTSAGTTNESSTTDDGFQAHFSNSSRGRGSSRRRSTTATTNTTPSSSQQSVTEPPTPPQNSAPKTTATTAAPSDSFSSQDSSPTSDATYDVPPHRRTTTTSSSSNNKSFEQKMEEEKQRLREIKVDEAFEQLKRDLGL